jgi:5'-3' exonuclease
MIKVKLSVGLDGIKGIGLDGAKKLLQELGKIGVEVGIGADKKYPNGPNIALIAAIHEFGSRRTPARPFFRPTIEAYKNTWANTIGKGAMAVLSGNITTENMMSQVGMMAVGDIKKTIIEMTQPPLSPQTIQLRLRAGNTSVKLLVDTGQLLNSIDSNVIALKS